MTMPLALAAAFTKKRLRRWGAHTWRDLLSIVLPLVVVAAGFWIAARFLEPAPPPS